LSDPQHDVPTFREFADLDKRHTALEATVTNQLSRISSDLTEIKMLAMRPPAQQETAAALALHRALDAFDKRDKGGGIGHSILITLALIGVGVTAFLIGKVFF
jgi:hypothetical protein